MTSLQSDGRALTDPSYVNRVLPEFEQAEKVQVFPVSARGALLAREAAQRGDGNFISPEASAGFSELETFILTTLSVRPATGFSSDRSTENRSFRVDIICWNSKIVEWQGPERLKMKLETPVQVASLLVEK